ncbi:hypothetical protein Y032_0004g2090 [Ancylostoma ceylanicum]|uniref:Cysteine-rich transmembrane CYSTM domain-containing protein n=2 Tax=Ancylostoma ceylanicum TaxID=53326 RepID=A0A016VVF2_9BILA|nr:hypothetical protein Y032_0004g2090 [Ancylostoma ceylanicum]
MVIYLSRGRHSCPPRRTEIAEEAVKAKGSYPRRVEPYPYQPQMYASAPTASPYYYSHSYASPYSQPCYGYSPYPPPAYYPYPPNTVYVQRDTGIDPCLACCWATLAVCCCCCWCN